MSRVVDGTPTYAPLYIHSFRLGAPRKLLEAQLFLQRYHKHEEIDNAPGRLRWCRHERGLTQEEVAKKVGVGRNTYINLEKGIAERYPFPTMDKLAEFYGVPVTDFLDEYNLFLYRGQGNMIREYRERLNLGKKQLAERLGVDPSAIWWWEEGEKRISKKSWERYFKTKPESSAKTKCEQ